MIQLLGFLKNPLTKMVLNKGSEYLKHRAEKVKTSYVDEELSDFIQIELTPENIKKLQDYKASLFTKTILPRIKSEENEKNEKIKQYLKDNPLKPGDVI